jgi:MFS family permease
VLVPINLIVLRVKPPTPDTANAHSIDPLHRIWCSREVLSTRIFWIPIAGLIPINFAFSAVQFNLGAYVSDLGFTQSFVAQLISIGSISMIIRKFLFGGLTDRVDHRFLFWSMSLFLCAALLLYQGIPDRAELLAAAILQGIASGGIMPMMGNTYASRFGTQSFGRVLGLAYLFTMIASFGSLLAGWLFNPHLRLRVLAVNRFSAALRYCYVLASTTHEGWSG